MGQGGCMAIESGVVLARCLEQESDLATALSRYEAERMPRTRWITEQSWKIGRIGQFDNRVACALRDLLVGLAPGFAVNRQLERAVGFEI
jgi:2-polyprenyl-6-methoxyphenol hydroxylase-like FAD-dependent oxidoreductase